MKTVYLVVDKTDQHYKKKFRSVHRTLEGAKRRLESYIQDYPEQAKCLVEILQVDVEE